MKRNEFKMLIKITFIKCYKKIGRMNKLIASLNLSRMYGAAEQTREKQKIENEFVLDFFFFILCLRRHRRLVVQLLLLAFLLHQLLLIVVIYSWFLTWKIPSVDWSSRDLVTNAKWLSENEISDFLIFTNRVLTSGAVVPLSASAEPNARSIHVID